MRRRALGEAGHGGRRCVGVFASLLLVLSMFFIIAFGRPDISVFTVVPSVVFLFAFCAVDAVGVLVVYVGSSFPPLTCKSGRHRWFVVSRSTSRVLFVSGVDYNFSLLLRVLNSAVVTLSFRRPALCSQWLHDVGCLAPSFC